MTIKVDLKIKSKTPQHIEGTIEVMDSTLVALLTAIIYASQGVESDINRASHIAADCLTHAISRFG